MTAGNALRPASGRPRPGPVLVQRRVSSRGGIQLIGQRIHVGIGHAG
jgi:hypothetical protein